MFSYEQLLRHDGHETESIKYLAKGLIYEVRVVQGGGGGISILTTSFRESLRSEVIAIRAEQIFAPFTSAEWRLLLPPFYG